MSDQREQPDAGRVKPRGEARWKEHLQAIAQKNERVKATGKQERRDREEREVAHRKAEELRQDAAITLKLDSRHSN